MKIRYGGGRNGHPPVLYWIVMKRGPKAPRRVRMAPENSAGARRRGAECPELLVLGNSVMLL